MSPDRARAVSAASLIGGIAGALAYVVIRVVELVRTGTIDPTAILVEAHVGFYWRALTAGWWGILVFAVTYALLFRLGGHERVARWVMVGIVPLALALAVTSWALP